MNLCSNRKSILIFCQDNLLRIAVPCNGIESKSQIINTGCRKMLFSTFSSFYQARIRKSRYTGIPAKSYRLFIFFFFITLNLFETFFEPLEYVLEMGNPGF
ncbi:hypothetical protein SAMN02745218_01606 [Desulfofundulus australicus DSM 11792]|uniref:Uncharacterized protein n=1 Tax=Desulfofundulus australicus DSM 11792 TaxID=1121425 RepID=A0A1M4ZHZ1_9FIRM|nr:hypothetical protein SAMN02745218_01606 [Desulfofundulus australicus DSM 11792]